MLSAKPSTDRPAPADHHRPQALRAALDHFVLGMRELEEQLPLPTDRRGRDTTPARQKATALRADIKELSLRLTQVSQQIKATHRIRE